MLVLDPRDSAPKREPDPSAIILFHHFDRVIYRILDYEHEHKHEHDFWQLRRTKR